MESKSIEAVLTGDIVGQSRPQRSRQDLDEALIGSFETLAEAFPAFRSGLDLLPAGRWQMVCARPEVALRAALYYRAEFRARLGAPGLDTRIAIGVGAADPARGPAAGRGAAHRRALTALEELPRSRRLALRLEDRPLGPGFDELVTLVDHLASRWTDRQALAVTGALRGWTQERIAKRWGRLGESARRRGAESAPGPRRRPVSQQTVAQHLQRAGWQAFSPALEFLEGLLI